MHAQFGRRLTDQMLVILRVMPPVKGPRTFAKITMNVPSLVKALGFSHDEDLRFDQILIESGGLPHEPLDDLLMVLA